MKAKTHEIGGVQSALLLVSALNLTGKAEIGVAFAGALIGAILPDIDTTKSKAAKSGGAITKTASGVISAFTTHRGIFHSVPMAVFFARASYYLFIFLIAVLEGSRVPLDDSWPHIFEVSLFSGYVSHLIYDTFNSKGIGWLQPFSAKRFHVMKIKTKSTGERIFALAMITIALIEAWFCFANFMV